MTSSALAPQALRADLLDFTAPPSWGSPTLQGVRFRPDHWLLVGADGRIQGAEPAATFTPGPDWQQHDHRGHLLMPGFIDTHVHAPQLDVIASWGATLLDWLNTYTFPAEQRYADPAVAAEGAARFLDALLAHGTTAAVVFPTVHRASAEALFEAASQRGMRLITGKVLMNRHAPEGLRDDVDGARADCEALIQRWHGQGRNAYAVTVRFAVTSTPEQLAMAGELGRHHPGLYMQTHVAENRDEVAWVARLFPEARSYLDVYHRAGLLHERAVLAHGIWLDAQDRALLRDTGAHIAHSPSSNLFLGSGLFDWQAAVDSGHGVSIASDVGGGTSLSLTRTLAEAYKVQALRGTTLSAWTLLHAATRGAAEALGLSREIGHLDPGATADLAVWRWAEGPVGHHRDAVATGAVPGLAAQPLHARVFAWLTLADERQLAATYVAGRRRAGRGGGG
ncbi:guanine deaminase [Rubrivivax rivuli]|uniref:Guanine deaminase n=1 Tax=Rubrivivax rivuli TaxID=1862385 RepID=A0A437RK99_9BURK|nr:guanine deaminase [Rubrivivax rivuli]RVU47214.1 guanine deaminase [Rubrivivax rivuli]